MFVRSTCTCTVMIARKYPYEERVHANHSKQLVYHPRVLRAASERVRARLERVSRGVEGCRALSFCPQNPTRSMPCEERSCVKSDLGDSASKPNCSCLTWPQIFFSRLSSDLVVSRLSFDFKIQGRELYSPFPLRDGNSTPVLNALPLKIKIKTTVGSIFIGRVLCVPFINSDKLGIKLKLKLWSVARKLFQNYLWI